MAVRDRHRAIGQTDALDERARGDERHIGLWRHAQGARGVRVEREQEPVTLAEKKVLEIARAEGPSRKIPIAAAVMKEGVDRRFGPHLVERLDHTLRAAVRDEVLVRERELHRPRMRWRATRAAKTGRTRWRRHRLGSNPRRQSHSSPIAWTNRGGRRTRPAS